MAEIVKEYLSTPPSARLDTPASVRAWLTELESQPLTAFGSVSEAIRTKFCRALVTDLGKATGARRAEVPSNSRLVSRWNGGLRLVALRVLKELSRFPGGSAPLADREGLESLLLQIDFPPPKGNRRRDAKSSSSEGASPNLLSSSPSFAGSLSRALRRPKTASSSRQGSETSVKFSQNVGGESDDSATLDDCTLVRDPPDWEVTDMALRCLNNALFLHEASRLEFSGDDIGGGLVAVSLISNPTETPVDILFLGSRLLFFCTLFEAPFARTAVESLDVVGKEAECTRALVRAILEVEANGPNTRLTPLAASGSVTQLSTALSDLLKAHFNLCLYYPRLASASASAASAARLADPASSMATNGGAVVSDARPDSRDPGHSQNRDKAVAGEGYHVALDAMLDPILEAVASLPLSEPVPLMPPMTHAIAALLNYPLEGHRHRWISSSLDQGANLAGTGHQAKFNGRASSPSGPPSGSTARKLADSVTALFYSAASSGSSHGRRNSRGHLAAAPTGEQQAGSTNSSRRPSRAAAAATHPSVRFVADISPSSAAALEAAPVLLARLLVIADRLLERYLSAASGSSVTAQSSSNSDVPFSGNTRGSKSAHNVEDPDDKAVRSAANRDGIELEDAVPPLLLLLRKIAADDIECRKTLRSIVIPADLDRSEPINKRLDLLGRMTRLMSSIILQRSARAAGEVLLALCDSDPKALTEAIGYGPCAGFLMNSGLASALPSHYSSSKGQSGDSSNDVRTINPITGQFDPTPEELAKDLDGMTEEEKEVEAEKLFVLFDRLNRTGVVKVQDPREAAMSNGKNGASRFEEIEARNEEEERKTREQQEEEDERVVKREMTERRQRKEEARRRAQKLAGISVQSVPSS